MNYTIVEYLTCNPGEYALPFVVFLFGCIFIGIFYDAPLRRADKRPLIAAALVAILAGVCVYFHFYLRDAQPKYDLLVKTPDGKIIRYKPIEYLE